MVIIGHPSAPTTARATGLAGMRTPIVRRRSSALSGMRAEAASTKVNGPGRLRFRIRKTALSTRQYSATWAMFSKTTVNFSSLLPRMRRSRSMAFGERSEQPKA